MPRSRQSATMPPGLLANVQQGSGPIYRRVYEVIRHAILTQELAPGTMLPSSQALADELGISRSTAVQAYDMLISEGYLVGIAGSGTYVAQILPEEFLYSPAPAEHHAVSEQALLSERGMRMLSHEPGSWSNPSRPRRAFEFESHRATYFPLDVWTKLVIRRSRSTDSEWLDYGETAGYRPLREALAEYLRTSRGVNCTPEQVIVVSGVGSAVTFISQVLTDPGDPVWIEECCEPQVMAAFDLAGAAIEPIPVDEEGLDVRAGMERCPRARLAVVTPSSQVPLGMTMSMGRRLSLLQWAHENRAWIIDYDENGEFRYRGRPLPSLQGLDQHGRTVHLATLSTVLFPSLRLAYIVVPESLVDRFIRARAMFDVHSPVFEQMVVADFITEGHFQRQIRRLRRLYSERLRVMLDASAEHLGGVLDITPRDAGIGVVGMLPDRVPEEAAVLAAVERGLTVTPLSLYRWRTSPEHKPGLVLGFTDLEPEEICEGVRALAEALRPLVGPR